MRQNHARIIWHNNNKEPLSPVFKMRWINSFPVVFARQKKEKKNNKQTILMQYHDLNSFPQLSA